MTPTTPPARMRADAQRNRGRLVGAARELFAERGLDVPLDDVAKRAGVGNATLYRHFPDREHLIAAAFLEQVTDNVAALDRALDEPDPWHGFVSYVRTVAAAQAHDRAYADLVAVGHPDPQLQQVQARGYRGFRDLVARAQASGDLRADFTPDDLVVLYMAVAGIVRHAEVSAPVVVDRFVALTLDGWRAHAATPVPAGASRRAITTRLREADHVRAVLGDRVRRFSRETVGSLLVQRDRRGIWNQYQCMVTCALPRRVDRRSPTKSGGSR